MSAENRSGRVKTRVRVSKNAEKGEKKKDEEDRKPGIDQEQVEDCYKLII